VRPPGHARRAAQQAIARDWTTAEQVLGLPDTGGTDPDDE
jgi:hypothetical protein